jgi:hypothetical protein
MGHHINDLHRETGIQHSAHSLGAYRATTG